MKMGMHGLLQRGGSRLLRPLRLEAIEDDDQLQKCLSRPCRPSIFLLGVNPCRFSPRFRQPRTLGASSTRKRGVKVHQSASDASSGDGGVGYAYQ